MKFGNQSQIYSQSSTHNLVRMRSDFDNSTVHCLGVQFFRGHSVLSQYMRLLRLNAPV